MNFIDMINNINKMVVSLIIPYQFIKQYLLILTIFLSLTSCNIEKNKTGTISGYFGNFISGFSDLPDRSGADGCLCRTDYRLKRLFIWIRIKLGDGKTSTLGDYRRSN